RTIWDIENIDIPNIETSLQVLNDNRPDDESELEEWEERKKRYELSKIIWQDIVDYHHTIRNVSFFPANPLNEYNKVKCMEAGLEYCDALHNNTLQVDTIFFTG